MPRAQRVPCPAGAALEHGVRNDGVPSILFGVYGRFHLELVTDKPLERLEVQLAVGVAQGLPTPQHVQRGVRDRNTQG
jgi:hypothetical protein